MANNHGETPSDDFLEQILGFPSYGAGPGPGPDDNMAGNEPMMLQLGSAMGIGGYGGGGFPLGLSLEQGKGMGMGMGFNDSLGSGSGSGSGSGRRFHRDDVVDSRASSSLKPGFHGQPMSSGGPAAPHPPAIRPRVRARRGQATDPHSIAERLRRERIAERIRALQDLVPSVNKTDRAAMLDEIVDYVKFLRLQVKVLSVSRLGGAGAVAPLVTDFPVSSVEDEGGDGGRSQPAWEKWSNDGTERQVAKLMEENIGAAMQFLQSKTLCIMPVSLASAIYHTEPPDTTTLMKPEPNPPS